TIQLSHPSIHTLSLHDALPILQAMILTEGDKMVKTPSYYVFELYKNHQDAQLIDSFGDSSETVSYTVSKKNNQLTISLCNFDLTGNQTLEFKLGNVVKVDSAQYIVGEKMDSHNDFENPETIKIQEFTDYDTSNGLSVTVPAMSVTTLVLSLS